jgi:hypothetical protein
LVESMGRTEPVAHEDTDDSRLPPEGSDPRGCLGKMILWGISITYGRDPGSTEENQAIKVHNCDRNLPNLSHSRAWAANLHAAVELMASGSSGVSRDRVAAWLRSAEEMYARLVNASRIRGRLRVLDRSA